MKLTFTIIKDSFNAGLTQAEMETSCSHGNQHQKVLCPDLKRDAEPERVSVESVHENCLFRFSVIFANIAGLDHRGVLVDFVSFVLFVDSKITLFPPFSALNFYDLKMRRRN